MSTNPFFRKMTQQPEVVQPGQRKPPQRALDARPDEFRAQQVAGGFPQGARNTLIPSTWTEAIQNPQVWAELRPMLVDEE
jgi:hypothetical protein